MLQNVYLEQLCVFFFKCLNLNEFYNFKHSHNDNAFQNIILSNNILYYMQYKNTQNFNFRWIKNKYNLDFFEQVRVKDTTFFISFKILIEMYALIM